MAFFQKVQENSQFKLIKIASVLKVFLILAHKGKSATVETMCCVVRREKIKFAPVSNEIVCADICFAYAGESARRGVRGREG
jgi:hypothetical protein